MGLMLAALLASLGSLLVAYLNRRSSVDMTTEQGRQYTLTTLIDTMQEEMATMRTELKEVKAENRECLADRDLMRGELRRVKARLGELEKATGEGC